MAAATEAYAALVSLMNVLTRIQYSCPVSFDQLQIQSLFDRVNSLVDFLEANSQIVPNDLAEKMVAAAFAAEDTIESYIVDRLAPSNTVRQHTLSNILRRLTCWSATSESTIESDEGSTIESDEGSTIESDKGYALLCYDLENALQEMDLIRQEAIELKEKNGGNDQLPRSVVPIGSSVLSSDTIKTKGFDEDLKLLIVQLTRTESSRQIVPVVGMGGIGKTTLARSVYKNTNLRYHFDIIAWVTVSQVFTAATIIRTLLRDIIREKVDDVEDEKLGETLHKCLYGRRYLIVLDDIWEVKAWDAINRFLPDNNDRSRILLTTRLLNVARSVGSFDSYEMKLLDDDKSWDLLSKMVFGQEVYPLQLEDCGKRIAKNCKGLPLAVAVIGGLLKMSNGTLEYWEDVARNISSIISGEDNEGCLEILSLSYHHLPIHLKPCFLYMATYPEDHEIQVFDVIKLWAADGFLKPNADELPQETAKKYLKDLIDRNLVSVSELDSYGCMKNLTMHDLVRELSIREAQKGGFVHVNGDSVKTIGNQRRLVVHGGRKFSLLGKGSARSLICFNTSYSPNDVSCSRLLRVFSVSYRQKLPKDIVPPVNLRFLRFPRRVPSWMLSPSISLLWNLETLIVNRGHKEVILLPCDIWKLRHIKHIEFIDGFIMPKPPSSEFVLEKLETLYYVRDLSDKVLNNIPNIKHLRIDNRREGNRGVPIPNMVECHKLERLSIFALRIKLKSHQMFPDSIRELTLYRCEIPWGSMTLIGSLPNLQILNIGLNGFKGGEEWSTSEGEFQSLKYLSIFRCNLVRWRTEEECSHHFPTLEHLTLWSMFKLEEIPEEVFGESMTLESIELDNCGDSVVRSAKRILEEQHSNNGNDQFTLQIDDKPYYSRPQDEEGEVQNQPISAHHRHGWRSRTRLVMLGCLGLGNT